jgi:ketosteroid isomerase-like protein
MSKQVVLDFFAARLKKDFKGLEAFLTDDFTATILPASLGIPVMNKEKFIAGAKRMASSIPDLKVSSLYTYMYPMLMIS